MAGEPEGKPGSATASPASTIPVPRDLQERLELANQLFRQFHATCFWHSPRDLVITEDLIPFVIKGLYANGGHLGLRLAGLLQANEMIPEIQCPGGSPPRTEPR